MVSLVDCYLIDLLWSILGIFSLCTCAVVLMNHLQSMQIDIDGLVQERRNQSCQVLLNFSILLLKLHFCYWNFHEILATILKFVLISQLFPHKVLKFV